MGITRAGVLGAASFLHPPACTDSSWASMPQQSDPPRLLLKEFCREIALLGAGTGHLSPSPHQPSQEDEKPQRKTQGADTGTDPSGDAGSGIAGSFLETAEAPHVGFPHPSEAFPEDLVAETVSTQQTPPFALLSLQFPTAWLLPWRTTGPRRYNNQPLPDELQFTRLTHL